MNKQLCFSSLETLQHSDTFRSTFGISPSLANAFLLVPMMAASRSQAIQELREDQKEEVFSLI